MSKRMMSILSMLVVLTLLLGACGGESATPTPAPAAVLAQDTPTPVPPTEVPAPTEAPVAPAEEAPVEEAPAADAEAFDLAAVVGDFAANIPDGWMNTGKVDDVKAAIDAGAYVIDVREASEFEQGHIPGAVNIPIRTLAQNLDQVPTDQPVLVYCASGHRAGMATAALRELGYDNVKAFSGGWKAWSEAGEEVSTEAGAAGSFTPKESRAGTAGRGGWLPRRDSRRLLQPGHGRETPGSDRRRRRDHRRARSRARIAEGAIAGAINIPLRTLVANLDQIPQDQPVVTYCASGFRSALANGILHTLGYDNVRSFPAGIRRVGSRAG
jgi:rhodanese-related sulfurtransferase